VPLWVKFVMSDCQRLWFSLETNHCVSACATCLLTVLVSRCTWSIEMDDGHGEGQVDTCRVNGLGAVKDGCEA
jgi:hypothetical protein